MAAAKSTGGPATALTNIHDGAVHDDGVRPSSVSASSKPTDAAATPSGVVVLVLGMTCKGKSALIGALVGEISTTESKIHVGVVTHSDTSEPGLHVAKCPTSGHAVTFIDSPGFSHLNGVADSVHLGAVHAFLAAKSLKPDLILVTSRMIDACRTVFSSSLGADARSPRRQWPLSSLLVI
jgi:predicted GTPase